MRIIRDLSENCPKIIRKLSENYPKTELKHRKAMFESINMTLVGKKIIEITVKNKKSISEWNTA